MRRAAKRDENEPEIVEALRKAGCKVWYLQDWDLLVRHPWTRELYMMEVKTEDGSLTPKQKRLIDQGWPLRIVRSAEDALAAIGLETSR